MTDEQLVQVATYEAEKVGTLGETSISRVITRKGKAIARGYNRRITDRQTLVHTELSTFQKTCKKGSNR